MEASPNSFLIVHRYDPELLAAALKVAFVRFDIHFISLSVDVQFTVGAGLPIPRHKKITSCPSVTVLLTVSFPGLMSDGASLK